MPSPFLNCTTACIYPGYGLHLQSLTITLSNLVQTASRKLIAILLERSKCLCQIIGPCLGSKVLGSEQRHDLALASANFGWVFRYHCTGPLVLWYFELVTELFGGPVSSRCRLSCRTDALYQICFKDNPVQGNLISGRLPNPILHYR